VLYIWIKLYRVFTTELKNRSQNGLKDKGIMTNGREHKGKSLTRKGLLRKRPVPAIA
jgi:hypothetical protein